MEQLANEWMRLAVTHAWQVTALIVLTAVVIRLFARNRPHLAFVLWLFVLVKCVTPPVWSSPSSVFSWLQPSRIAATAEAQREPGKQHIFLPATAVARFDRSPVSAREWQDLTPQPLDLETETLVATGNAGRLSPVNRVSSIERILIALLVTWLSGAALIVAVAVFRYLGFRWHLNRRGCIEESRLTDLVRDLSRRLKVKRSVRLLVSTGRVGPAVIGVLRPTVLLPAVLVKGKSNEELKPLLAHELIHVRRGDLWYGMLQVIAQALWWCHPLVWWAGRRASREAERCCDEEVIAELGCSPARYARSLLGVLELKKTLKPVPAFPGVRPVEVTSNRLERIMKLGQGCRRRTPWWCWIVLLIAAAGMLPGAAFLASEKDASPRDLTLPQGKHVASIPPLPRNVPAEPLMTCVYEVADLVEKARSELGLDEEAAKLAVEYHPGVLGGPAPVAESEGPDSGSKKKGPRAAWFEGKLIVHHTAARHDRISKTLTALRKHGFGQVVIEARLVTGPEKTISAIGSNWTVMAAAVASNEKPTHQDPDDPTRALRHPIGMHGLPTPPLPDKAAKPCARGQTVIEKRLPVMFEIMDDGRASKVIQELQDDGNVNMLAAPKVTTFNGQVAEISSCSQRPFVVGVKDGEPQVRVVDEGLMMRLCPIPGENAKIRLELFMTLSTIRDVETTTIPRGKGQPGTTLQIPVVAKTQLNMNVLTPSGRTLVIGGLKTTDEEGKEQSVLVMLRPTALAPKVAAPSGRKVFGLGVNSDAGVTGTIAIDPTIVAANPSPDEKTPAEPPVTSPALRPIVAAHSCKRMEPPSDDEVIRALGEKTKVNGAWVQVFEKISESVRIVKERIADYIDPPRNYPLIGPAQLHRTHYKCSVHFTESVRVGWPIPHKFEKEAVEVVYVETNHFHTLDETQPEPNLDSLSESSKDDADMHLKSGKEVNTDVEGENIARPLPPYLKGDVQYFAPGARFTVGSKSQQPVDETKATESDARPAVRAREPSRNSANNQANASSPDGPPPFFTRIYNVADLVIPVPNFLPKQEGDTQDKRTKHVAANFESLMDLITTTVAPATWEEVGSEGAIEEFPTNLSLVISQTEEVHEEIADLLQQLRRLRDVQVLVTLETVRVFEGENVADLERPESIGGSTMPVAAAADLLRSVGGGKRREKALAAPRMTLFNGQKASLRFTSSESERMNGVGAFHIQPVISDDRESVRLTFVVEHGKSEEEASKGTTKVVPIGESLVVDVTGNLDARQHDDNAGERLLVVLTPQIIVNEPEEAASSDVLRVLRH